VIEHEVQDFFEGSYLFTWNEIEAKFDKLTTDHTTAKSRRDIKDARAFAGIHPGCRSDGTAWARKSANAATLN
jgi:hypothetical protein